MSDIVEQLRYWNPVTFPLVAQAADEIERLRAENEALRKLLREMRGLAELVGDDDLLARIDAVLEGK